MTQLAPLFFEAEKLKAMQDKHMADLVRDPRWGRVMESPGEDPYLNSQMVAAMGRPRLGGSFTM